MSPRHIKFNEEAFKNKGKPIIFQVSEDGKKALAIAASGDTQITDVPKVVGSLDSISRADKIMTMISALKVDASVIKYVNLKELFGSMNANNTTKLVGGYLRLPSLKRKNVSTIEINLEEIKKKYTPIAATEGIDFINDSTYKLPQYSQETDTSNTTTTKTTTTTTSEEKNQHIIPVRVAALGNLSWSSRNQDLVQCIGTESTIISAQQKIVDMVLSTNKLSSDDKTSMLQQILDNSRSNQLVMSPKVLELFTQVQYVKSTSQTSTNNTAQPTTFTQQQTQMQAQSSPLAGSLLPNQPRFVFVNLPPDFQRLPQPNPNTLSQPSFSSSLPRPITNPQMPSPARALPITPTSLMGHLLAQQPQPVTRRTITVPQQSHANTLAQPIPLQQMASPVSTQPIAPADTGEITVSSDILHDTLVDIYQNTAGLYGERRDLRREFIEFFPKMINVPNLLTPQSSQLSTPPEWYFIHMHNQFDAVFFKLTDPSLFDSWHNSLVTRINELRQNINQPHVDVTALTRCSINIGLLLNTSIILLSFVTFKELIASLNIPQLTIRHPLRAAPALPPVERMKIPKAEFLNSEMQRYYSDEVIETYLPGLQAFFNVDDESLKNPNCKPDFDNYINILNDLIADSQTHTTITLGDKYLKPKFEKKLNDILMQHPLPSQQESANPQEKQNVEISKDSIVIKLIEAGKAVVGDMCVVINARDLLIKHKVNKEEIIKFLQDTVGETSSFVDCSKSFGKLINYARGIHDNHVNKIQVNSGNTTTQGIPTESSVALKLFIKELLRQEKKRVKKMMEDNEKKKELAMREAFTENLLRKSTETSTKFLEKRIGELETTVQNIPNLVANIIQQQLISFFTSQQTNLTSTTTQTTSRKRSLETLNQSKSSLPPKHFRGNSPGLTLFESNNNNFDSDHYNSDEELEATLEASLNEFKNPGDQQKRN